MTRISFIITPQLLAVCLTAIVPAQGSSDPGDGAIAPVNTWYTAGGSAARAGRTATPPLVRPPQRLWVYQPEEGLVGEPLVWGNLVVLESASTGQRTLRFHSLRSGRPVAPPVRMLFDGPLHPCMWQQRVAFRAAGDRVKVVEVKNGKVHTLYEVKGEDVLGVLMLDDDLFVLSAAKIERHSVSNKKLLWGQPGQFVGIPSILGNHVYAVQTSGVTKSFDRANGSKGVELALPGVKLAPLGAEARVILQQQRALVYRGKPSSQKSSSQPNLLIYPATERHLRPSASESVTALPSMNRDVYLVRLDQGAGHWVEGNLLTGGTRRSMAMLGPESGPLRNASAPASIAGDVAFIGNLAFSLVTHDILWRAEWQPTDRIVPARDTLLVRTKGQLLAIGRPALLDTRPGSGDAQDSSQPLAAPLKLTRAVTVLDDYSAVVNTIALESKNPKLLKIGYGRTKRQVPATSPRLVFDRKQGFLSWRGNPEEVARAYFSVIGTTVDTEYIKLFNTALMTNVEAIIARFEREALARGGGKRITSKANARRKAIARNQYRPNQRLITQLLTKERQIYTKAIERYWRPMLEWLKKLPSDHQLALLRSLLERSPSLFDRLWTMIRALNPGADERTRAAQIASVASLAPERATDLWQEFEPLAAKAEPHARSAMARAVLLVDPEHAGATSLVRSMVTIPLREGTAFDPLAWLDLMQTLRRLEVKQVKQPAPGEMVLPYEQKYLAQYQGIWRKDLVAFQSKRLLVITPLSNPAGVARCLSLGEMVCDTLIGIFKNGTKKRHQALRLRLVLCDSKEEYRKAFLRGLRSHLGWTAGHYNGRESIMYLPPGKAAFERVMAVFAHELTHHWIDEQCPMFTGEDRSKATRMNVPIPGLWIVEGFANMIEEFDFDLAKRTYRSSPARIPELDRVANTPSEKLLPWNILLTTHTSKPFDTKKRRAAPRTRWTLGRHPVMTEMSLFYAQSAAVCHYFFHAEDGKYRQRLLQFLGDHYAGKIQELDAAKVFGMSYAEIGRRAVAHARKVISGNH